MPNVSGRLYTFASGSTTQKNAYADVNLSTVAGYLPDGADGNYIPLNARGECLVYTDGTPILFVHKTAAGALIDSTEFPAASTGGGGTGPSFVDDEIPTGSINGSNRVFLLANTPNPPASLGLYLNGQKLITPADYGLSGQTITTVLAPQTGDVLRASYRY